MIRRTRTATTAALGLSLAVLLGACATSGPRTTAIAIADQGFDPAAYCVEQGGMVVNRVAVWNTNADKAAWVPLNGALDLCEFESGEGDATTRISVDLTTLSSEQPTLAAIAYLSKVTPPTPPQIGQNPGWYDCTAGLAGASQFGTTVAGGGWVAEDEPVFTVMNLCVFPDMSAIDEFGIAYFATGAIRGADLTEKFRYQPGDKLPAMFDPNPDGGR